METVTVEKISQLAVFIPEKYHDLLGLDIENGKLEVGMRVDEDGNLVLTKLVAVPIDLDTFDKETLITLIKKADDNMITVSQQIATIIGEMVDAKSND